MNDDLKRLISEVSEPLKRDDGFRLKGRVLVREDRLLRAVVFHPEKTAASGAYRFDVTLNLGLPGLSSVTASRREWVISASLGKLNRIRNPGAGRFELTGADSDVQVASEVHALLEDLRSEFLMSMTTPDDLLSLLGNSQKFRRLDLWPWNEIPRFELASVFSAFLGRVELADEWKDRAIRCALDGGMGYAVEAINDNVEKAYEARRLVK